MNTHDQAVREQFEPRAEAYLHSLVHAQGPDLAMARDLVGGYVAPDGEALDVGCGAGHLSFALAPLLGRVAALDPAPAMLDTVRAAAAAQGLGGISTHRGSAEALPFEDASFDLVATRYSAHHWVRLDKALREMRRVLRPGGNLLVIDVEGDGNALLDSHLQALELLRDFSHVRDRTAREWRGLLAEAGFKLAQEEHFPLRLEFGSWVRRMATPADRVAMIRTFQVEAPQEVQRGLGYEPDGSFTAWTALFWARART
jgi:ubiquinone/menaquinone biosynthesis C-methylase UbiE